MKQVKCGCEFNADTLVSLCDSHAAYFAAKFRKDAPAIAPLTSKQEAVRNQVLVAAVPAAIAKSREALPVDTVAHNLVALANAIAART